MPAFGPTSDDFDQLARLRGGDGGPVDNGPNGVNGVNGVNGLSNGFSGSHEDLSLQRPSFNQLSNSSDFQALSNALLNNGSKSFAASTFVGNQGAAAQKSVTNDTSSSEQLLRLLSAQSGGQAAQNTSFKQDEHLIQLLLSLLLKQSNASGDKSENEMLHLLIHLLAQRQASNDRQTPKAPITKTPATAPAPTRPVPPTPAVRPTPVQGGQKLLVTALGSSIINSSDEPIAAVPNAISLPTAQTLTPLAAAAAHAAADVAAHAAADAEAAVSAARKAANDAAAGVKRATMLASTNLKAVDPTAPKFQDHAQVWQDAINTGRTRSPLIVNGETLHDPALVTSDTAGNLVKVPLATAVDAPSTEIPFHPSIKRAMLPGTGTAAASAVAPNAMFGPMSLNATADVAIPPVLVAANLPGNEKDTVPPGFVLAGTIKLFGGLEAERYTFQGTPGGDGKAELIVLTQSPVSMDKLLPSSGFSFGNIMLQHPTIAVYLNQPATSTNRGKGLYLDAGLALEGSMVDVGTFLKDISATSYPSIDVSVYLGGYQGLSDAFKPPSELEINGVLNGLNVKLGKFLELKTISVSVKGVRATAPAVGYTWNASLSGTALFIVPGTVAPLNCSYTISKVQSTYNIELKLTDPEWKDAMGVPGFHLTNAVIKSTFTTGTKDSAFTFDINASMSFDTTMLAVTGHYSSDAWDFRATVGDFSLQKLENGFAKLFQGNLSKSDHNVVFTGISMDVNSKDKALVLKGAVAVDNYASADASLTLGPTGVKVVGNMNNVKLLDSLTLTKAHLELVLTKGGLVDPSPTKPGTAAAFNISGEIKINSEVTVDAEVSFAKSSGTEFVWCAYAKIATNLPLHKFIPKIPADLDIGLDSIVIMASNTDNDSLFPAHAFDYKVKKGFQLRAKIQAPQALCKTLHSNPVGMVLELDLSSTQSEVQFIFGADQSLVLKPGMVAPSIKAGIMITANPQVFVEGDMTVQLKGQPGPLVFALRLQAGATQAQASASLMTDWVNPFGVSPKVKVLAPVTLGVLIDYAAATYPSGLSFQGGLQVGETILHAAFEVGQNPEDGVLLVHAENLGLRDIVSFASLVIDQQLPLPPNDLVYFKDLYLGLSSGGTIGPTFYPPGVTFNADLLLFGKEAKIHCAVDKKLPGLGLHLEFDAFQLGPVMVSGNTAKNPTLDLEISPKMQRILIDGKIALFDSDIATTVTVDVIQTNITFDARLKFTDMLFFEIKAHAAGQIKSIKDVVKADFSLEADFEQAILDHMVALANTYIATAKKAADEGLESAKAKLDAAKKSYEDHLAQANRDLTNAQAKWDKKNADVHAAVDAKKKAIADEEKAKRAAVDSAQAAFNNKIAGLERNLNDAKSAAAAKIKAADDQLASATRDANSKVDSAKKTLDDATRDMTNRFGDADRRIQDAQNAVNDAQNKVNGFQRDVDDCANRIKNDKWYDPDRAKALAQITGYEAALRGGQAGLLAAQGVLSAARAVLDSAAYKAAKFTMDQAANSLNVAKQAADASIRAAQGSLSLANEAAKNMISTAQNALDAAKKGCDELHVFDVAKAALSTFLQGEAALLSAADAMLQELSKCAEKVAFDAAQGALNIAKSATKELDAAKAILTEVEHGVDEFAAFGQWALKHAGNIFNVRSVHLSGSLNDAANKKPFAARIKGTFAEKDIDVGFEFTPGQAEDFVKKIVMQFIGEAKTDLSKFIK